MKSTERLGSKENVMIAANAASEKQATDVVVIEIAKLLIITDYFLICSGANDRQTRAIADEIKDRLREVGAKPAKTAGEEAGDWILLDYSDFVVHIFTEEKRQYYQLERLWRDAPQVEIESA